PADVTVIRNGVTGGTVTVFNGASLSPVIRVIGVSGDGTLAVSVDAGVASDNASNQNPASAASPPAIIDNTPPTIEVSGPTPTLTNTGPVTFTVTYEAGATSTLSPANISLLTTNTAFGFASVSGSGSERTITINNITGDGTISVTIAAGTG